MNILFIKKILNLTVSCKNKRKIGKVFQEKSGRNYNAYLMFLYFLFKEKIVEKIDKNESFEENEIEAFIKDNVTEASVITFITKKYSKRLSTEREIKLKSFTTCLRKFNQLAFWISFSQVGESTEKEVRAIYRFIPEKRKIWEKNNTYHQSTLFG